MQGAHTEGRGTGEGLEIDWSELDGRIRPWVARRVAPSDVDDVMQDVWLRMLRGIHQVRGKERLGSWLFGVARSAVFDHMRMRQRHPLAKREADEATREGIGPEAADLSIDAVGGTGIPELIDEPTRLLSTALVAFVAALPKDSREALTLTELEGRTGKEAAEILGLSVPALKSRVLRGKRRLEAMIHACCEVAIDARGHVMECTPRPFHEVAPDCCQH
jgi:RNA polymerase sigma-70 factor (ECF subfamily)